MSAHREPDKVADYAKNAALRGLRGDHRRGRPVGGASRRRRRPLGSAGDRRAADEPHLGRGRARRAAVDRPDAARRSRRPASGSTTPGTPPCSRPGSWASSCTALRAGASFARRATDARTDRSCLIAGRESPARLRGRAARTRRGRRRAARPGRWPAAGHRAEGPHRRARDVRADRSRSSSSGRSRSGRRRPSSTSRSSSGAPGEVLLRARRARPQPDQRRDAPAWSRRARSSSSARTAAGGSPESTPAPRRACGGCCRGASAATTPSTRSSCRGSDMEPFVGHVPTLAAEARLAPARAASPGTDRRPRRGGVARGGRGDPRGGRAGQGARGGRVRGARRRAPGRVPARALRRRRRPPCWRGWPPTTRPTCCSSSTRSGGCRSSTCCRRPSSARSRALLGHNPETAGGMMNPDFVSAWHASATVAEALASVRGERAGRAAAASIVCVVDERRDARGGAVARRPRSGRADRAASADLDRRRRFPRWPPRRTCPRSRG